jgi:glyoxylase-like metal-dependent hydrolase (beta-lactamase superfamily II)
MRIRSITAPNPGAFTLDGTRTWILGDTAVIDPGPAIGSHVDAILDAAPRLRTILITHRHGDHAPAAVLLRARCDARVLAPHGVLEDQHVDTRISGGETIDIDGEPLRVIATPGHTSEHVCFLTADGQLFTGDTILGSGTTAIFPPDGDMSDYLATLRTLRELAPSIIHPAHGPSRDDAVALIDAYIWHRLEREQQIASVVASKPMTVPELREAIYAGLDPAIHRAAEAQLLAHLIKLQRDGVVTSRDGRYAALPS